MRAAHAPGMPEHAARADRARRVTARAVPAGSGPALVLLHGFTGTGAVWAPLHEALGHGRRLVFVDLPGHGAAPPPPAAATLHDVADAVVSAVAAVGVNRADWLGYSLGGRVALHVVLRHPACVARLVLESASPGIADPRARAARADDDDALADAIARDGLAAFVERWTAQPLFAAQARLPAAVREAERLRRLAQAPEGLAAALRVTSVGRQAHLLDRLGAVTCPVLLVAGADDATYRAHAAAMAARLPWARTAIVPSAGHTPHLENPAAFHAAVAAFLADTAAAA